MIYAGKKCLTLLFVVLSGYSINAQRIVSGMVSSETGTPVPFASIKWKKDSTGFARNFSLADVRGNYCIRLGNDRGGWLEVSAVGYQTIIEALQLYDADSILHNIVMSREGKTLKEIIVRNEPAIKITGDTTSYLADKFKRGNEANVGDLLSQMPGFTVGARGNLTYQGRSIDRVLINGDDLAGRNYSDIVSKLDINGIEKLQVIQNHYDKSSILSGLTGGNEQVLNLSYKKGFLQRFFGTIQAAGGLPWQSYEAGGQALGLFEKTKLLLFQNNNTAGQINADIGIFNNTSANINLDPGYDIELLRHVSLAQVNDIFISNNIITPIYQNRSNSSSASFLISPHKKFSIRGRFGYDYDKYWQEANDRADYFTGTQITRIEQQKNILNRLGEFNGMLSFNYLIDSRNQVLTTLKMLNGKTNDSASSIVNHNEKNRDQLYSREHGYAGKIIYNHIFNANTAFSANIQYQRGNMPAQYAIHPAIFSDFFLLPDIYDRIIQDEKQRSSDLIMEASFIRNLKRHLIEFSVSNRSSWDDYKTAINASAFNGSSYDLGTDSTLHSNNRLSLSKVAIKDTWKIGTRLTASVTAGLIAYDNVIKDINAQANEKKLHGFRFTPDINVDYKLSGKDRFSFSFNTQNRFSELPYTAHGVVISSITSLYSGMDSVQNALSQTERVSYSYTNLLQKRLFLFSSLWHSRTPLFYLSDIQPYSGFTYADLVPTTKNMDTWLLSLNVQKLSRDYHTRLSPMLSFSRGSSYRLAMDQEEKIRFNQVKAGVSFNTDIKAVQINGGVEYNVRTQKTIGKTSNRYWESSIGINWKISPLLFLDGDLVYDHVQPFRQSPVDVWVTSAKLLFKSKNQRWEYGVRASNLLNQSSYATSMLTATMASSTIYRLFPRVMLGFLKYRFS